MIPAIPTPGIIATAYGGGLPLAGAHSYWRIRPWSVQDRVCHICNIYFAASPGGAQLATGGTALGSANFANVANAFNGDTTTWANSDDTGGALTRWIGYHFPSPVLPAEIRLQAYSTNMNRMPLAFWVDYSDDGVTWTTSAIVKTNALWTTSLETRSFTIVPQIFPPADRDYAKVWAIRVTAAVSMPPGNFKEIQFRDGAGGANLIDNIGFWGTPQSSAGFEAYKAVDGDTTTRYSYGSLPVLCGYLFDADSPNPGDRIAIFPGGSTGPSEAPGTFTIEWSSDGVNWHVSRTHTGHTYAANTWREFLID